MTRRRRAERSRPRRLRSPVLAAGQDGPPPARKVQVLPARRIHAPSEAGTQAAVALPGAATVVLPLLSARDVGLERAVPAVAAASPAPPLSKRAQGLETVAAAAARRGVPVRWKARSFSARFPDAGAP
ncbi:hypothetical protein AGR2A_Cc110099 [Agrobacterium genomosp. 2 str. CFBP 5494]|uniref:Uncharacterized protein n=1 Tax=Agrobacterium genomosp. 2 str. CFBP 5494 TaxID=1183436 RepID=A0A9W5F2D6_9HYPH|nr:hypothetical protein AGR2A_Cc110099 [Agrobacterium genomosp. 2 str. CFBP 5494]